MSYRQILEFFFQIHDPRRATGRATTPAKLSFGDLLHERGAKAGRSRDDRRCGASGLWPGKVVTEVAPAGEFWEAEPEHQDYLERYPDGYTCHFVGPIGSSNRA